MIIILADYSTIACFNLYLNLDIFNILRFIIRTRKLGIFSKLILGKPIVSTIIKYVGPVFAVKLHFGVYNSVSYIKI
jgi:hypothetical protein